MIGAVIAERLPKKLNTPPVNPIRHRHSGWSGKRTGRRSRVAR